MVYFIFIDVKNVSYIFYLFNKKNAFCNDFYFLNVFLFSNLPKILIL